MVNKSRISKLLSLMLRHKPDEFGLEVDTYGYVPVDQVVQAIQSRYEDVLQEDIIALIKDENQQRFEMNDFGIRALYAHSFFVEMDGDPMSPPPDRLYMGTTLAASRRFPDEGIISGDRYYVHLSLDRDTAASRSHERAGSVVVEILADRAHEQGIAFFARGEVILTDEIPSDCVGQLFENIENDPSKGIETPVCDNELSSFGRKPRFGNR